MIECFLTAIVVGVIAHEVGYRNGRESVRRWMRKTK